MAVEPENMHHFKDYKIGDMTELGEITDIFFLIWGQGYASAAAHKEYSPKGLGKSACTINGKTVFIGELLAKERN